MAIFANMESGKLLEALRAVGVESNDEDGSKHQFAGSEKLEPWNARDVAVPATKRPPILNQENLTVKMPQEQRGREYAQGQPPDGYEQYMPTRPDVFG